MKISKVVALFFSLAIIISGCDIVFPEPTIDTSTDEIRIQSSQKVRESLSEPEQVKFDEAIQILAINKISKRILSGGVFARGGSLEREMTNPLHGKTAQQIISEAEQIKIEREARERKQALEEIKELEEKRINAETSLEELKKFEVIRSRFYQREEKYTGKKPIIEITVKNGTNKSVSLVSFEGTIASPGRSVPWHKDTFSYSIPGGLETGEEQSWTMAPNRFSGWGNVDAPADAVFTVTVETIVGADGEVLYSTKDFTKRDKARLSKLKNKYNAQ